MIGKILAVSAWLVFSVAPFAFAESGNGGYAGAFRQLGLGARCMGMGGAFVSVADDATASFWNPAGLAQLEKKELGACYRMMFLDRRMAYLTYVQPAREMAGIGLAWVYAGVRDVMGRDDDGRPTEKISNSVNSFSLGFGRRLSSWLALGISLRYTQFNLVNLNTYGLGFDLGAHARFKKGFRVGAVVEDIGMKYTWSSGEYWSRYDLTGSSTTERFPVNFRVGASLLTLGERLLVAADLYKSQYQDIRPSAGTEYWVIKNLAARIGYNGGAFSFGLGLKHCLDEEKSISFDYVFVTSQVSEDPDHMVSLQFGF